MITPGSRTSSCPRQTRGSSTPAPAASPGLGREQRLGTGQGFGPNYSEMQGPSPPPPLAVCLLSSSPPARGASRSARCPAQRSTDQRGDHQVRRTLMFLGGPSGPAPSLEGGRGDEEGSWKDPCCSVPPDTGKWGGCRARQASPLPCCGYRAPVPTCPLHHNGVPRLHQQSQPLPTTLQGKHAWGAKRRGGTAGDHPGLQPAPCGGPFLGKVGQNPSRKEKQTKGMGLDLPVLEVPGAPFLSAPPQHITATGHHGSSTAGIAREKPAP